MEEHRCSEAYRVQAVEHAAVAFDHMAPVLHATVALDDITRPPAKPSRHTSSANSAACQKAKGVIQHSIAPISVARATPPMKPSTVFEGDRLGAILCLPASLPQTYCSTSESCTTMISQAISSRLRPS